MERRFFDLNRRLIVIQVCTRTLALNRITLDELSGLLKFYIFYNE